MRYVVTGAAGFIGSPSCARSSTAGMTRRAGTPSRTTTTRPEEERALPVERIDLVEDRLDLDGVDGVFHLQASRASEASGASSPSTSARTSSRASGCSRPRSRRARTVLASSSSVYGDAASYPTPEDTAPRPLSPYGITKLAAEHLAQAYRQEYGLDVVTARYFTIYGPRQRPDMAFARMVAALAASQPFELLGDGTQSRSFTYVEDAVDATIGAMERASSGSTLNVGGGVDAAGEALGRIAGRRLEIVRSPRREGDATRTAADTAIRARSGGSRRPRSRKVSPLNGAGPLIGSRPHDGRSDGFGAGGRAGSRSLVGLAAPESAVVAAGRRCPRRRRRRPRSRPLGRLRVARRDDRLPRSAVRPARWGQIQSLATNPRTVGEIIRSESVLQDISKATGIPVSKLRSSISTRELVAAGQIRGINPLIEIAVKGPSVSSRRRRARGARRRARLDLRHGEDRAPEAAGRGERGAAGGGRGVSPGRRTAGPAARKPVASTRGTSAPEPEPERGHHDGRRAEDLLQDDLFEARQLLNLAESVESSRVVEPAAAGKTTARSSRTSLLVGALIGLLVGAIAALAADPIATRRAAAAAVS